METEFNTWRFKSCEWQHSFIHSTIGRLRGSVASFQRGTKCEELHHMHRASLSDDFQFAVEAANHTCPHCAPIFIFVKLFNRHCAKIRRGRPTHPAQAYLPFFFSLNLHFLCIWDGHLAFLLLLLLLSSSESSLNCSGLKLICEILTSNSLPSRIWADFGVGAIFWNGSYDDVEFKLRG